MTRRVRKRTAKETADGIRAWLFLRHVEAYEAAWRAHAVLPAPEPVFEPGPFPIRLQTAADLEAAPFDLLAWQDPWAEDGPASPFWVQSGMVEAVVEPDADLVNGRGDRPNRHDILTGTKDDGTAYFPWQEGDHTCNNWTSSAEGSAQVGHHDRVGGGNISWNSAHASRGCSQEGLVSTGGAGLFYCFAAD